VIAVDRAAWRVAASCDFGQEAIVGIVAVSGKGRRISVYVDALSQTIADLVIGPSGLPVVPVVAVVDGLAHQPLYAVVVPGHDAGDAGSVRLSPFGAHAAGVHAVCHGGDQRTHGGALDQIDEAMATVVGVLRADAVCRHHRASVAI